MVPSPTKGTMSKVIPQRGFWEDDGIEYQESVSHLDICTGSRFYATVFELQILIKAYNFWGEDLDLDCDYFCQF